MLPMPWNGFDILCRTFHECRDKKKLEKQSNVPQNGQFGDQPASSPAWSVVSRMESATTTCLSLSAKQKGWDSSSLDYINESSSDHGANHRDPACSNQSEIRLQSSKIVASRSCCHLGDHLHTRDNSTICELQAFPAPFQSLWFFSPNAQRCLLPSTLIHWLDFIFLIAECPRIWDNCCLGLSWGVHCIPPLRCSCCRRLYPAMFTYPNNECQTPLSWWHIDWLMCRKVFCLYIEKASKLHNYACSFNTVQTTQRPVSNDGGRDSKTGFALALASSKDSLSWIILL